MKEFRPLILWVLILGIAFAVWNNFSGSQAEKRRVARELEAGSQSKKSLVIGEPASQTSAARTAVEPVSPSEKQPTESRQKIKNVGANGRSPLHREFAVLAGFAKGDLKEKSDYEFIPIILRFGFDLNRFLKIAGPKQLFEFELEPFFSVVTSPDKNAEFGANLLFKYGYFVTKKLCPYIEAGSGIIYITQHTREQSTQFNFIPQAGAGVSYFLRDNLSINAGYRYRHLSNASIRDPNKGINVDMLLAGVSWYF